MTLDTYRPYIGRTALVDLSGVSVQVRVLDIRSAFGRIDAHVTPIAGVGMTWLAFARLSFIDDVRGIGESDHCHICGDKLHARDIKAGAEVCWDCTVEAAQ
jgi:hypothetical protein